VEPIKRIVIGTEEVRHPGLPTNGTVEHPTKCGTIDRSRMDAGGSRIPKSSRVFENKEGSVCQNDGSSCPKERQRKYRPLFAEILAVHAALLRNGKVLYFGGSQHLIDPNDPRAARLQSVGDPRLDNTRTWDPATGQVSRLSSPQPPQPPIDNLYDLFCCGHAFLPDGRLLVGGGTSGYPPAESDHHHEHYRGSRRSSIFDPSIATGSPWSRAGEMVKPPSSVVDPNAGPNGDHSFGGGGRWYPTLMTMPDRSIIALGGHPQEVDPRHSNYSIEAFAADGASGGGWSPVGEEPQDVQLANDALQRPEVFPRAHLLPNVSILSEHKALTGFSV
jgi:hypothetical protein